MKRRTTLGPAPFSEAVDANSTQSWPGLFFTQRADLTFEWVGAELQRFIGLSAESLKASPKRFWTLVHPSDVEAVRRQIRAAMDSGRGITHSFRVCHGANPRVSHVSEWRRPRLDVRGKVCGFEALWMDITRQARAEQRLVVSAWKETLAELTPGLAHDFNNVLTGILALSEGFLTQIDSNHSFHEGLSMIQRKARQATQLVRQITDLYEDRAGKRSYHDVNSIAAELMEILSKVIPKRIELSLQIARKPLPVYVDGVEFRRVLFSLAVDAINGMPSRGKLHLGTSRHAKLPRLRQFRGEMSKLPATCLSMAHSGDCFAAGRIDDWFDPFAGLNDPREGGGLSLLHAKLFAGMNGGVIAADSGARTGTTFRLWLPEADFSEAGNLHLKEEKTSQHGRPPIKPS